MSLLKEMKERGMREGKRKRNKKEKEVKESEQLCMCMCVEEGPNDKSKRIGMFF